MKNLVLDTPKTFLKHLHLFQVMVCFACLLLEVWFAVLSFCSDYLLEAPHLWTLEENISTEPGTGRQGTLARLKVAPAGEAVGL